MSDSDLNIRITAEDLTAGAFASAKSNAEGFKSSLSGIASDGVRELAALAAEVLALDKALELVGEGIHKADELRDLGLSLNVFTGSVDKGREAMEYFEKQAINTRDVADDLASTFRDLLPLAMSRFGANAQAVMEPVTVMLSQLATESGKTLDQLESGFRMMLSGRVMAPGRNALLQVLGITDIKDLDWSDVFAKMEEKTNGFINTFGQSWESTMAKAKESILDEFAAGFNGARGDALTGMAGVNAAVESVKPTVHELGADIAEIGPTVLRAGEAIAGSMKMLVGGLELMVGGAMAAIGSLVAHEAGIWAAAGDSMPAWMKAVIRFNTGVDVNDATGRAAGAAAFFGAMRDSGTNLAVQGQQSVLAGTSMWGNAMAGDRFAGPATQPNFIGPILPPSIAASNAAAAKEFNDDLNKMAAAFGHVAISTKATGGATKDATQSAEDYYRALNKLNAEADIFVRQSRAMLTQGANDPVMNWNDPKTLQYTNALNNETSMFLGRMGFLKQGPDPDETKIKKAADAFANETVLKLHDAFTQQFSADIVGLFEKGGAGFVQAMSGNFHQMVSQGAQTFTTALFGQRGDGNLAFRDKQGDWSGPHDPTKIYDLNGNEIVPGVGMKVAEGALGAAQIGMGAYQNALSGADGSRTSGTLSGGLAGAGMGAEIAGAASAGLGALIGGAIGLLIGGVASYLGKQEAQSNYKYFRPMISDEGVVTLTDPKNITTDALAGFRAQVQSTFDTIHDQLVRSLLKVTGAIIPALTAIDGKFQDNPSGHFLENFQAWLTNTLPKQIEESFKGSLAGAAETLGMSVASFNKYWDELAVVDPTKRAQLIDSLFTGLADIQKASAFFHAQPIGDGIMGPGSQSYQQGMIDLQTADNFLGPIKQGDAEIIRLGQHIKDLSPEGQIQAIADLGTAEQSRLALVKAAIKQVYDTLQQEHRAYMAAFETLDVQGFTKADGTVDQYGLAQYYKQKAQGDLSQIGLATDPAEISRLNQEYIKYIMSAEQSGIAGDPTKRADWINWAHDQLTLGQTTLDNQLNKLGLSLNTLNDQFNAQLDPALQDLLQSVNSVTGVIGGGPNGGNGPGGGGQKNLTDAIGGAVVAFSSATPSVSSFGSTVSAAVVDINAFRASLQSSGNQSGAQSAPQAHAANTSSIGGGDVAAILSDILTVLQDQGPNVPTSTARLESLISQMLAAITQGNFAASTVGFRM